MKKKLLSRLLALTLAGSALLSACGEEDLDPRGPYEDDRNDDKDDEKEKKDPTPTAEATETTPTPTEVAEPTPAVTETEEAGAPEFLTCPVYNDYYEPSVDAVIAEGYSEHIEVVGDTYPELAASIEEYSKEMEAAIKGESFDYVVEAAKEYCADGAWEQLGVRLYQRYGHTILRADQSVCSIMTTYEDYMGGAHGVYYNMPVNYDTQSGELLALDDVLQDGQIDGLAELLADALEEQYEPGMLDSRDTILPTIQSKIDNRNLDFSLGYDSITFYFQIYELAAYASGAPAAVLKYEDYPDLVKEYYTQTPENYIVNSYATRYLPGTEHSFYYYTQGEYYESESDVHFFVDEKETVVPLKGYECSAWIVHMDGENYLYFNTVTDNDYNILDIYEFCPDGSLNLLTTTMGGFYDHQPADPEHLHIYVRGELLSNHILRGTYRVDSNGLPVLLEKDYLVDPGNEHYLTLKQDISLRKTDGSEEMLSAGTKLLFYRTDNKSYAQLKDNAGNIYQLEIDCGDWPQTYQGIDVEDLFDGTVFAG